MKLSKSKMRQIIREEINEIGQKFDFVSGPREMSDEKLAWLYFKGYKTVKVAKEAYKDCINEAFENADEKLISESEAEDMVPDFKEDEAYPELNGSFYSEIYRDTKSFIAEDVYDSRFFKRKMKWFKKKKKAITSEMASKANKRPRDISDAWGGMDYNVRIETPKNIAKSVSGDIGWLENNIAGGVELEFREIREETPIRSDVWDLKRFKQEIVDKSIDKLSILKDNIEVVNQVIRNPETAAANAPIGIYENPAREYSGAVVGSPDPDSIEQEVESRSEIELEQVEKPEVGELSDPDSYEELVAVFDVEEERASFVIYNGFGVENAGKYRVRMYKTTESREESGIGPLSQGKGAGKNEIADKMVSQIEDEILSESIIRKAIRKEIQKIQ